MVCQHLSRCHGSQERYVTEDETKAWQTTNDRGLWTWPPDSYQVWSYSPSERMVRIRDNGETRQITYCRSKDWLQSTGTTFRPNFVTARWLYSDRQGWSLLGIDCRPTVQWKRLQCASCSRYIELYLSRKSHPDRWSCSETETVARMPSGGLACRTTSSTWKTESEHERQHKQRDLMMSEV